MTKPPVCETLAVGISDLLAHRECPRRAAYGARRHQGDETQDHELGTPEAGMPATWYGSMLHEAIDAIEDGHTDEAAIELAWRRWGSRLEPTDLTLLHEDLAKFHERDFQGVRTVLAEGEIRVPLTTMPDGRPIYFRGRIDRLYELLAEPGHFIHEDYKSSKWQKNQDEVDADLQLWSYNFLVHEYYPECVELEQWLNQFRGGMVSTRKSEEQRAQIREWLEIEARAYFAEHDLMDDGLPAPRFNQWCPWCPILESCQIIPRLSDWALSRIALLRPEDAEEHEAVLQATPMEEYIAQYDDVQTAIKTLERYQESVKQLVREAPEEERGRLGFRLTERRESVLTMQAREALYERLGHRRFLELVSMSQKRLQSIGDPEVKEWALGLVEKVPGSKVVNRVGGG